jgi:prepilin peptidase CpaA
MTRDIFVYALLGALAIGLLVSMYTDVRYRKIYNVVTLPMALGAPLYWIATGDYGWHAIGMHMIVATCAFLFCLLWFSLGWMGGGDLKLYTALALWFTWQQILLLFFYSAVIGLVVTIIALTHHKMRGRQGLSKTPYGVAISLAGLWIAGEPYFNHFG